MIFQAVDADQEALWQDIVHCYSSFSDSIQHGVRLCDVRGLFLTVPV